MGEVFTPEEYVQQMLSLFDAKVWTDENVVFFEPTCGHGNIAMPIFFKRYSELKNKYTKTKQAQPGLRALANALHTLWAIDICSENIELTRKRLFDAAFGILLQETKSGLDNKKVKEFAAHMICTIAWQVHENETLSALGTVECAFKTKLGVDWIKNNDHKPIDFSNGWCNFYKKSEDKKVVPLVFQRAMAFIEEMIEQAKPKKYGEFNFAREIIVNFPKDILLSKQSNSLLPRTI